MQTTKNSIQYTCTHIFFFKTRLLIQRQSVKLVRHIAAFAGKQLAASGAKSILCTHKKSSTLHPLLTNECFDQSFLLSCTFF